MSINENAFCFVAVAEFHLTKGNTLSAVWPEWGGVAQTREEVAHLCLPDGAHLRQEDTCFLLLPVSDNECTGEDSAAGGAGEGDPGAAARRLSSSSAAGNRSTKLFGIAYFLNRRDSTKKRGADQKSLLAVLRRPLFDTVEPFLRVALPRVMDAASASAEDGHAQVLSVLEELGEVVRAACKSGAPLPRTECLFGCDVPVTVSLPLDAESDVAFEAKHGAASNERFGGAQLSDLVKLFGEETMVLWYSLLMSQRVLFCGQGVAARTVGMMCLAAPMLVAPLRGFVDVLTPYVALTDLDPVMRPRYVCGTTNQLFATKTDWWDCLADVATGRVSHNTRMRVMGEDRTFIRTVIKGLEREGRDEEWVRQQFREHTSAVMRRLATGSDAGGKKASKQQEKWLSGLVDSPLYRQQAAVSRRRGGRVGLTLTMTNVEIAVAAAAAAASGASGGSSPAAEHVFSDEDDSSGSSSSEDDTADAFGGAAARAATGSDVSPRRTSSSHLRALTRDDSELLMGSARHSLSRAAEPLPGVDRRSAISSQDDSTIGMRSPESLSVQLQRTMSEGTVPVSTSPRRSKGPRAYRRASSAALLVRSASAQRRADRHLGLGTPVLGSPPPPPSRAVALQAAPSPAEASARRGTARPTADELRRQLRHAQLQSERWLAEVARIAEQLAELGETSSSVPSTLGTEATSTRETDASREMPGSDEPADGLLLDFPSRRRSSTTGSTGSLTGPSSVSASAIAARVRRLGSAAGAKLRGAKSGRG